MRRLYDVMSESVSESVSRRLPPVKQLSYCQCSQVSALVTFAWSGALTVFSVSASLVGCITPELLVQTPTTCTSRSPILSLPRDLTGPSLI
ncbi:hypothetical protein FKP32DRAFT_1023853 [Trametes sanguinea]|nr:hypothetical protein FKP32DRAFT_1023853 [Trametes sanguinea]